jgi:hypothetical protein
MSLNAQVTGAKKIEQEASATIYYHPDTFTRKNNAILSAVGLVGITALILGAVAAVPLLPGMPPAALYGLLGVGGGLVLADVIAVVALAIKNRMKHKLFDNHMTKEANNNCQFYLKTINNILADADNPKRCAHCHQKYAHEYDIFFLDIHEGKKEIHVFESASKQIEDFKESLILEGFVD